MEREQIPIISIQVSIVALVLLSYKWINGTIQTLSNDKYYLSVGAIVILFSPIVSQIIYSVWKKYFGFKSYDITKYLSSNLSGEKCEKVEKIQSLFDNFWHNSDNINSNIISYSRTRSFVCQMYLFSSRLLGLGSLTYLFLAFYYSYVFSCSNAFRSLSLFLLSMLVVYLFDENYKIASKELIRSELKNINDTKKDKKKKKKYDELIDEYNKITGAKLEDILEKIESKLEK
ncbi:hypothetical protein A2V71_00325 [Candidatus Berkelbacteria bacterium RBG_13_40_8]|uniref:Uncharacterized protein n=1 Tax=Candidatus Berkelbacteria bacterium RBG_13_40_8 TaxID=1797467 RepID=A0A1F5DPR6_9BACT|nr:MAG: hypothetical protein A2V71_00325 [Candidatus Berkelbacteria bacterium RBG_13_40_8]